MNDTCASLYRVFLVGAIWIAISGACFANQYLVFEFAPATSVVGVSVALWSIGAIAAVIVSYLISTGTHEGGWCWTARTLVPAALFSWLLAWGIFGAHAVGETFFIPGILALTATLILWRTTASLLAWAVTPMLWACAAAALLIPSHARWIMVAAAAICFLFAAYCYSQSPARRPSE